MLVFGFLECGSCLTARPGKTFLLAFNPSGRWRQPQMRTGCVNVLAACPPALPDMADIRLTAISTPVPGCLCGDCLWPLRHD